MIIKDGILFIQSKVAQSTPKSKSVRTTIPEVIAGHLHIKVGSEILWGLDPKSGEVWIDQVDGKKVG